MNQLPKGWEYPTIEEILQPLSDGRLIHQGWSPQCERRPTHDESEWGVLKTTAIQAGAFAPNGHKRLPDALEPRPALEVKEGDILLTCAGPRARCGVACLVRRARRHLLISGKMYRFRVNGELIDPRFIEAMLLSPDLVIAIDQIKTGGSDSGLNLTHHRFRSLRLPLPPTREQERIVGAIEEAFSKLDAGEAGLRAVRQRLKRMRDAVLTAAVAGRLVPQDPTDIPAAELVADLRAESRESAGDLPAGWAHVELGTLLTGIEAGKSFATKGRPAEPGERAVIKVSAMTWGDFRPTENKALPAGTEIDPRWFVRKGDLLVSRANTSAYVGVPCV